MNHALDFLLTPSSIAVVGASQSRGAVGNEVLINLMNGRYAGRLFPINPRYEMIEGHQCYSSLSELPCQVDHVILALGDQRVEAAFDAVIEHGAKACTIFTSLFLDDDTAPILKQRIQQAAADAGILLLGGNGMGFYNFSHNVRVCGFATRAHSSSGNVSLISQSGSGMAGILDVEERIDFNFAASTGQELDVGLEDMLDYALDLPTTRVVGLFMETCRKPAKFIQALEKAKTRHIPIVVLKVGKSELAAKLAISHSGALAGQDAVFDAVFSKYGVQRVNDMSELATTLIMFAQPHRVGDGGLATIHDSGGERQLLADMAVDLSCDLAILNKNSERGLEKLLDPGMPAVNPLDAWGRGGVDADAIIRDSFSLLMSDPNTALGAAVMDRGPAGRIFPEYLEYLKAGHEASNKPVFLVANHQSVGVDKLALEITQAGFPVLDSVATFLVGARCMMAYRDFLNTPSVIPPHIALSARVKWRDIFNQSCDMDEQLASQWLADSGVPMALTRSVNSLTELELLLDDQRFPVVLKTAEPGINHKSDVGGVILNIQNAEALFDAYQQMHHRLGAKAIVAPMITGPGREMILGLTQDDDFGPMVVLGLGGVSTEWFDDVVMLLPPFDASVAEQALGKLRHKNLFSAGRTHPRLDEAAFCAAAAVFSVVATEFSDIFAEVDINPIRVMEKGCIGLDALLVIKPKKISSRAA